MSSASPLQPPCPTATTNDGANAQNLYAIANSLAAGGSGGALPTGAATAAKQDTGNASLATIATNLPSKGQSTMANSQPVTIASDQTQVPVVGSFVNVAGTEFTRPGTTSSYAAGQVFGPVTTAAVITFANCARANGGSGIIKKALLNLKWPSGTPVNTNYALRLKLYNVAPTPIADGSLWTTLQANFSAWQGSFDFISLNSEGATYTGSDSIHGMGQPVLGAGDSDIPFVCAANDRNLYGVLVAEGAFTQVASQVCDTSLLIDQN